MIELYQTVSNEEGFVSIPANSRHFTYTPINGEGKRDGSFQPLLPIPGLAMFEFSVLQVLIAHVNGAWSIR